MRPEVREAADCPKGAQTEVRETADNPKGTRVAAVDIGTNTVLLLVAERVGKESVRAIEERAVITRLGEGVDRSRRFLPAAVERTKACIDEYARVLERCGVERLAVVGTSAMRDAAGGEALRSFVAERLHTELRVISGEEEARLSFGGALSGLGYGSGSGEVVVFDIGGGSTELILGSIGADGRGRIRYSTSVDIGSVRLTERHAPSDPPTPEELSSMAAEAERAFATLPAMSARADPVGIAGTMTTLAAVHMRMTPYDGARVHGAELATADLLTVVRSLGAASLDARRQTPGLQPGRADVIVAGGLIALALLSRLRAERVRISDRGVRWGLALELANHLDVDPAQT